MSTERWQELDRIFAEAQAIPAEGRPGFVGRACGADQALQAEVLSLLAANDASGEFMVKPALDQLAEAFATSGWSLQPGEHIGAYTVVRLLGAGGAGEVWRARDERLSRDVAIKVLLPHLSTDTERLRRFAEEARAAGALSSPNILTVHDVGEHHGLPYLVAECLDGQNLRERLAAGPMPVAEAAAVAIGIAHGLAAAHARGIIHRDLKPENVFLTADGNVKVLDFGIAKLQPEGPEARPNQTMTGTILGTAAYMAPEQVKGERTDARSDLFALGVMLYEMLGGEQPFRGASVFETLHAIITRDPPDLLSVNEHVPPALARIVMRLLQKPREARFQSAVDLAWALEPFTGSVPASTPATTRKPEIKSRRASRWIPWIALPVAAAVAAAGGSWLFLTQQRESHPTRTTQFTWTLPRGVALDSAPVVSPDSRHIVFVGKDATGQRLFVRDLSSLEARVVRESEGAREPFWSPDSKSIGFFAKGRLMKVAWPNGVPVAVADAPEPRGGAWSRSGVIVFAPDVVMAGLNRVEETGAGFQPASLLDVSRGDTSHTWPAFLPDGSRFLYYVRSTDEKRRGIYLGRTDRPATQEGTPLLRTESDAVFASLPGTSKGALFYVTDGRIGVRRFDTERLTVDADARTIGFTAGEGTLYDSVMISASSEVLAFAQISVPFGDRLHSVTRDGEHLSALDQPESQHWPRISPDGRRVMRTRVGLPNNADVWVDDLERGTRVRVTTAVEPDMQPVWAPDGKRIAYVTGKLPGRGGPDRISIAAADGAGVIRTFSCPGAYCEPTDWSRDGTQLLLNVLTNTGVDIWMVAIDDEASARPLLNEAFAEHDARLSPDGRWIAYVSEEAGRPEVSAQSMTGAHRRFVISADGGAQPVWRRDGEELFFVAPDGQLQSVSVRWKSDAVPEFGLPIRLKIPPVGFAHWGTQYDVSPDGSRIYFLRQNEQAPPHEIHVVMGWQALLE